MEFTALAGRRRCEMLEQTKRAVLIAVTLRRIQGEDVSMADYIPELEAETQEAKAFQLLAYFEGLVAKPPHP